ncbi:hypothetical protein [Actinoplanes sp. HUAS TT8]|uniref:hypothetical protein n=1 Tax=Actinoplanes sp. HUAS TT8 TaxID=3447453 RepID=UPI003F522D59
MSSQIAPVTSDSDWDRLNNNLRLIGRDISSLRQKVAGTEELDADTDEKENPVPDPDKDLDQTEDLDQQRLEEDERLARLEQEIDGMPDGDYDPEPDPDDPEMGA